MNYYYFMQYIAYSLYIPVCRMFFTPPLLVESFKVACTASGPLKAADLYAL